MNMTGPMDIKSFTIEIKKINFEYSKQGRKEKRM